MFRAVANCRFVYILAAVFSLAFLAVLCVPQQAQATTKIGGNVAASSLRSGVDYETDADTTITIGEDDNVTIKSLVIGSTFKLTIKGTSSGSLTVKNGISGMPGSLFTMESGTLNVRRDDASSGNCYGINMNSDQSEFAMTGGIVNIVIQNSSSRIGNVYGLYTRSLNMGGGNLNITLSASPSGSGTVKGIAFPYECRKCNVTGGVINVDAHSATSNAYGIATITNSSVNCSFTNASITANATTDIDANETCGLFLTNDDECTNTFFNCTVISSGTYSGLRSDGNMVVNGDCFIEVSGKKHCGLDMQYSKLTLEGESASLSMSTENTDSRIGCALIKQLSYPDYSFGDNHWDSTSGKIVNGNGDAVSSSNAHSTVISHKLNVSTNRDFRTDQGAYNLDGYFVTSNKTGDAVTKGPRTYAIGVGRTIKLTATTNIPGHKFIGWYRYVSGQWQRISTSQQFDYKMATVDDSVIAVFESGKEQIGTLTFYGGMQPVGGQTISVPSVSVAQKGVTITNVQWYDPTTGSPVSGTFEANKAYALRITVSLGSSYEWASTVTASLDGVQISNVSGDKNVYQRIYVATDPTPTPTPTPETQPMHRLYNPNSGEHFYTAVDSERDHLVSLGWHNEGEGWTAPKTSNTPVYRLYNAYGGEHHYTMDASEKEWLVSLGWNYEGIGWYSDDAKTVVLYREYNPNAFANNHNYTTSWSEHSYLVSIGWRDEGTAWYGVN